MTRIKKCVYIVVPTHVETVVLLSKGEIDSKKVRVEFSLEGMDMSGFQKGATYQEIRDYVKEQTGLSVSSLYISQIKRKCGLDVGQKGFMSTSLLKNIAEENESYATGRNLLKIFVPEDTIGVYVNAVTKWNEEEMPLLPNGYLGLFSYPYKDEETGKIIYECEIINMDC